MNRRTNSLSSCKVFSIIVLASLLLASFGLHGIPTVRAQEAATPTGDTAAAWATQSPVTPASAATVLPSAQPVVPSGNGGQGPGAPSRAQGPRPPLPPEPTPAPRGPRLSPDTSRWPVNSALGMHPGSASGSASINTLAASGLSFSYARTFGVTKVAYKPDTKHINFPWGLGSDGTNIWIGELWGNRALKYTSTGGFKQQIGVAGFADGSGTTLWSIADVATDGSGNIWVVDADSSYVVKFNAAGAFIDALGVIYQSGTDNSHFYHPVSIAFDSGGNIYVSDGKEFWSDPSNNQRIQVFDHTGAYLSTIGVTGVADSDNNHFDGPQHIAIYGNQLYVADFGNNRVQIFDISNPAAPAYSATIVGTGSNALNEPSGVAVSASYVFVSDSNNNRVQVFDRVSGNYVATIGGSWGTAKNQFEQPSDVAVDSAGNLYVADFVNQRVQVFNAARTFVRTIGVTGVPYVTDGSHYNMPSGVAIAPDGSIYLTEENGNRLDKLNAAGKFLWSVGAPGVKGDWNDSNTILDNPADVAVDAGGRVYVADRYHGRVQIFNSDGTYSATLGGLNCPGGVGFAPTSGYLYVADSCDNTVLVYDTGLDHVATLGVAGVAGSDNGHFDWPEDVAVDASGNVYVSDQNNNRVQVFDASLVYAHTVGESGVYGGDFGHFGRPAGVFVDSSNRLYVGDSGNDRVQVFNSSGDYLTTIGGDWGYSSGQMRSPTGVAVDATGAVYVTDEVNHRLQKFTLGTPGWTQMNINGFGDRWSLDTEVLATFNGQLYAAASDDVAQIWRTSDGSTWSPVVTDGFGVAHNLGIYHLAEFNGKLYAGTFNCPDLNCASSDGGQIWRSSDGAAWEEVVSGGFGNTNNFAINSFAVFSGELYAATSAIDGTMQIYRSASGDSGSWSPVVSDGFGGSGLWWDVVMDAYGGYLYASVSRAGLAELWRTNDGTTWSSVFTNGLGNVHNSDVDSHAEFNGEFYIGLRNVVDEGGTGAELWKTSNGTTFTRVFNKGLGNANNGRPYGLYAFQGSLYMVFGNFVTGSEVWRSVDGTHWQKIGFAGWGDSNNILADYYDKGAAAFSDRLYIGTYNYANGGELWSTVIPSSYSISGSVGTSGVKLSYTVNGSHIKVLSDFSGNYQLWVPQGWSGTVTPSKMGYTFLPPKRSYLNVLANLTGENYTASP